MHKLYWVRVLASPTHIEMPMGIRRGIGITATSMTDALGILQEAILKEDTDEFELDVKEISELSKLDQNHVVPNMGNHLKRGVWYPLGYEK